MRISPIHVCDRSGQVNGLAQVELACDLVMRPRGRTAKEQGGSHGCDNPPISLVSDLVVCHGLLPANVKLALTALALPGTGNGSRRKFQVFQCSVDDVVNGSA